MIVGLLVMAFVVHCLSHVVIAGCIWALKFFLAVSRSRWRIVCTVPRPPPVVGWSFEIFKERSAAAILLSLAIAFKLSCGITVIVPAGRLPLSPLLTACIGTGTWLPTCPGLVTTKSA